ncbi:ABC transporter ATP-binding protein [Acinetobacter sp. RF15A]|uniref:ABC transporter ATP-binding protein n=1 Tax=Acinetobacter lwoffii TaxID=28090 RepID=A0A9D3A002_ACILW|nr:MULTISPECIES: ABC transporter ATP-binding protein [unclassified Acinetobacter]MDM1780615.1 ABC transporter ATP-binding protein [Acinetobacter indicus]HJF28833.1 ABC transporter ATP-binding protein [Acinetobacter lwoffii]QKQ69521.1 ABC transporter ATP-binding protein [Acinetobacter sp. 10FS3-1]TQR73106.1 ABC transporter ATP-binding protein [Acinetobacter sp. RF14B]TSH78023.1 ABC transporter ATP-binding protein [Acinetobacter sp. RF15A]
MTDALTLRDLSKTYRNGFQALKGINLNVPEGEFYALLGPNGAGKSTTIGIISSLTRKSSGTVEIFGYDLDTQPSKAKQCLGVVPQEFNFAQFEKTFDILVTQAGYYGIPKKIAQARAEEYLNKLGLWDKRSTQARMLSGGMKRRLMIARAMMHEPKLLILDEPTAGVDIELRRSMWDFLNEMNENGTSIILTTHYLEEAEMLCRRIAIIDRGVIKEDTSMKNFLNQLNEESFIFDLAAPIEPLSLDIIGVRFNLIDPLTLEITLDKAHTMNDLFQLLESQNIQVRSMRNKSNRLEELFVKMVEKNLDGAAE